MSTIRSFFSPTKTPSPTTPSPVIPEWKSIPANKPDNKLIVSNMKSVINSVKMKKKHKKRKRNSPETAEIRDISSILQSNLSFVSPNRTELEQKSQETLKGQFESIKDVRSSRLAGREEVAKLIKDIGQISAKREKESPAKSIPEVKSVESPTTDSSKENNSMNENSTTSSQSVPSKSQSTSNAFEFMMTARYKSIGGNSPGKEPSNKDVKASEAERGTIVRRKLMLEEWADRKGRAKKRLNEAADDEYIDMVMDKRAKRLKTLLKNGKNQKPIAVSDEEITPTKPSNGLKLKLTKGKNRIEDSEDDDLHENHKSSSKSSSRKKNVRDSATNEKFCEKLSSPIKKRDSLLGYFSKLTKTPSDNVTPNTPNTTDSPTSRTKKRGRPKKVATEDALGKKSATERNLKRQTSPIGKVEDEVLATSEKVVVPSISPSESPKTSSEGRPKRLCRDRKISYLINEDYPPLRTRAKKVDEDYLSPKAAKPSKPTKLAPIFAKAVPKPLIDPVALRARHEFLMSGIPEKMKIEIEKQRQYEEFYEIEFEVFPKISHVGHYMDTGNLEIDLSKMNIRFRLEVSDNDYDTHSPVRNSIIKVRKAEADEQSDLNETLTSIGQKELIRQLKQGDTSEYPFYRCFKQLKRKNAPEPIIEEDDNSIELVIDTVASANGNELFTEKYRPLSSMEVFINTKPLIELQKFLSSWKESMDGREYANSDDDFESSSNSAMSSINKAIVLTGPAGCGKTMFVYALANEMNFKVLEINAGAKRTGKKVLKKLQEATQSHHVNNNQCSQSDRTKNVKAKSNQSDDSEDSGASQKLSLILIEDAEVVFEQDLGFVESINQLVTTTKRPVILVTNQINCPHLCRFINRNMISFKFPKVPLAAKWMSTLSVAEHCYVTEDMCRALYQQNKCDFRKTLLELQFFIQSTNRTCDSKSVVCTNTKLGDLFFKDQNRADIVVPFPVDFTSVSNNMKRIVDAQNVDGNSDTEKIKLTTTKSDSLNETIDFLDIISTAQLFEQKTDSSDRVINHLSDDINHFMVEQSIKIRGLNWSNHEASSIGTDSVSRKQQLASNISSRNYHSTRGFDLDMEPCLRSICRSELLRSHKERRSSRFYHYLRLANSDSFGTKVLDDHCLIFSSE